MEMKSFEEFINESHINEYGTVQEHNGPLTEEDIEVMITSYFDNNVMGSDSYDRERDRLRDLKFAAKKENDPLTDSCISYIAREMGVDEDEIYNFREYIEDKLAELAEAEL